MLSRIHLDRRAPLGAWSGDSHGTARNGQFALHGLDPDSEVAVSFFEPKRKLGATVRLLGQVGRRRADRRQARAVRHGHGAAGRRRRQAARRIRAAVLLISMVVTPGEFSAIKSRKEGTLLADQDFLTEIDPINYPKDPASDAQGRIAFPALVPGATYRIIDLTRSAIQPARSSARNSPSSPARHSTWAIS